MMQPSQRLDIEQSLRLKRWSVAARFGASERGGGHAEEQTYKNLIYTTRVTADANLPKVASAKDAACAASLE